MTLVNALSSTRTWYSSGPITPRMCAVAVGLQLDARRPPASGLHDRLATLRAGEGAVAGPLRVARRGPGDIGDDVLLKLAGEHRHEVAAVIAQSLGRDVLAGVCGLPGEAAPARPAARAVAERCQQPAYPVLEHRACCGRVGRGQEGQHVDVAVPEHVASVCPAESGRVRRPRPRPHRQRCAIR